MFDVHIYGNHGTLGLKFVACLLIPVNITLFLSLEGFSISLSTHECFQMEI